MRSFVLVMAAALLIGPAKADVFFDNLATGSPNALAYEPGNWLGVKFNATQSFDTFDVIKLNLFRDASVTGTYSISLYSDNSSAPNLELASLTPAAVNISSLSTSSTSFVQLTNVSAGGIRAVGNYWIVVKSSGNAADDLNWAFGPNSQANQNSFSSDSGSSWSPTGSPNILGGFVSVPEPGSLLLGGIAACGGVGAWWRRKRKAVQVAAEAEATV